MADQTPAHPAIPAQPAHPALPAYQGEQSGARRGEQRGEQSKADPVNAQYMINITPEQYASYLKQAEAKDVPPRQQIEMGGTGTAKASFKDAADGDVEITTAEWSSTGPIVVTADEDDPTSAKIMTTGLGPATVTVNVSTTEGSAQTSTDLMVINKIGAPVAGTIEIAVEAPAEGQGVSAAQSTPQGAQIMPVPAPAPDKDALNRIPPAQVMSQPSPQPQPQSESESQPQPAD